ncbi:hypothetical protein SPBR_07068 [Sporothrix brasiliensis 5110]|uniref:Major facilitator superfamily (MFS) profile domain-containing protein n=1 Tax=Sporothrix brasiliensis 5110 TaxID=1398154 RepID=A0A0C2IVR5_9PEZI|nr:uncharacterized protein SPBR_07068 [Sporothrix brasiliensis 5110]KIH89072.1 hypothetical protein SPBR_07068 [Sporothrix brasiliensis 5110]
MMVATNEDKAVPVRKTLMSKVRFLTTTGVGQFADGYLNTTIGLVVPMLGYLYWQDNKNIAPVIQQDTMKSALPIGMIIGQVLFGIFGDAFGRQSVYGRELLLTMVGTLLVITMPPHMSRNGVVCWVTVFRIVTGLGIGGDYPMTASLAGEENLGWSRRKTVLAAFSWSGVGALAAAIIFVVLLAAFKSSVEANLYHLQWVWRLLLGIGLIPCALTLYARLRIRETQPYREYVEARTQQGDLPSKHQRGLHEQFADFRAYFAEWQHMRTLLAISLIWFLFDIAFYGVNLNQGVILARIGVSGGSTPWQVLHNTAVGNIIQVSAGYVPGYWLGIFLPDWLGHRRQQFLGSAAVTILYAAWAGVTNHANTGGLVALFTISQLSLNAGLASTTFLVPVEVFPTKVRATSHGIAAASGKVGAVVTSFAFNSATNTIGLNGVLGLLSGIMFLCTLLTYYVPETKGLSLAEIEADGMYKNKKDERVEVASPVVERGNISAAPSYMSDSAVACKV